MRGEIVEFYGFWRRSILNSDLNTVKNNDGYMLNVDSITTLLNCVIGYGAVKRHFRRTFSTFDC